jgi:predicted phosphoribosyltransferase
MLFRDRKDAARALIERLGDYRGKNPLVLGIPRGGVPIGADLADALGGELDVVLVRKIGAPDHPEFAVGALTESGEVVLDPKWAPRYSRSELDRVIERERRKIRARRGEYGTARISPAGRTILLVDDGIATGHTMLAAVGSLRAEGAGEIVACSPVASRNAVDRLEEVADRVVVAEIPEYFAAVGQFYDDFSEVSDEEASRLLARRPRPGVSSSSPHDERDDSAPPTHR